MPLLKCKMCGGDMHISADKTFGTCEYCGSTMTLPKVEDDQRAAAFNRGNHFRRVGEFDKALAVYERIVAENDADAEAHWCCALCRFGIEYVEDPASFEWLPTCHRASFDSFLEDVDYLAALEHSDGITKRQYQKDAAKIAEVQRGILATSRNEEPFDVFICYKESDENGSRTRDSLLAQEIYYQLTEQGRRVFFSRITLEDKGGAEYEPYIFAALNSAKVMIVVGTTPAYFNAVWVKNEWSRFLSLMKKDHSKLLLPCYRDMDPYDLPEALSVLQSYDMSKIGFIQDLIRGINKVLDAGKEKQPVPTVVSQVVQSANANVTALVKRGNMALEDSDWTKSNEFFDRVLDLDAECAESYLGKALSAFRVPNLKKLTTKLGVEQANIQSETKSAGAANAAEEDRIIKSHLLLPYLEAPTIKNGLHYDFTYKSTASAWSAEWERVQQCLSQNRDWLRAQQYAAGDTKAQIEEAFHSLKSAYFSKIRESQQQDNDAVKQLLDGYAALLENPVKVKELRAKAEQERKADYDRANALMEKQEWQTAVTLLEKTAETNYESSEMLIAACHHQMELQAEEEARLRAEKESAEKAEAERQKAIRRQKEAEQAKKNKTIALVVATVAVVVLSAFLLVTEVIIPGNQYKAALALVESGQYEKAIAAFEALGEYKDSLSRIEECNTLILDEKYDEAAALMANGQFEDAIAVFTDLRDHRDSIEQVENCRDGIKQQDYDAALALMENAQYEDAIKAFQALGTYSDSKDKIEACETLILDGKYNDAVALMDAGKTIEAYEALTALDSYKDSAEKADSIFREYFSKKYCSVKKGDYVVLGSYEQDNNSSNGKEDIEWLVLDVKDGKALVISKYAPDCQMYNAVRTNVTWENCNLRTWLNSTFLNTAFSATERAMIPTVTVSADKNPDYNTNPGNATQDKVFLLSITEVKKYFISNSTRECKPTAYTKAQGAYVADNGNCWWWLRSPGGIQIYAANVNNDGGVSEFGRYVYSSVNAVRPALWITIE